MDTTVTKCNSGKVKKPIWQKILDFPLVPLIEIAIIGIIGNFLGRGVSNLFRPFANEQNIDSISFLAAYFSTAGTVIAQLIYMWVVKPHRPMLKTMGTSISGNNIKMAFIGLVVGFAMNGSAILAAALHGDVKLHFAGGSLLLFILFLIAVLFQASNEEILCRCFLYHRFNKIFKRPAVAMFIASTLFGFLHLLNPGVSPLAIINVILAGLWLGLLMYCFDSIWMAIAAHLGWNYSQSIIFGLPNSGNASAFSLLKYDMASATNSFAYNVDFGVEGTVFVCIMLLVIDCGLIVYAITKKKQPTDIWK